MIDLTHLDVIELRLSHERARLAAAKTPYEREMRQVWVDGIEKERAAEMRFLGCEPDAETAAMSDDELCAALGI